MTLWLLVKNIMHHTMDLIYGTSTVNLQKWFMQAGEPTSSWSGTFLDKQRITSWIDLFATDVTSPKVALLSRCHKFFHRLLNSESCEVQTVARLASRDFRSNLGLNLKYMRKETGLNPWSYVTERIKEEFN